MGVASRGIFINLARVKKQPFIWWDSSNIVFFFQTLEQPTLQNVSATVQAGKLLAVIGPVGAGKVCINIVLLP